MTPEEVTALDKNNKLLVRNFNNPIVKDTVVVPSNGVSVLRFKADNPGKSGLFIFLLHIVIYIYNIFVVLIDHRLLASRRRALLLLVERNVRDSPGRESFRPPSTSEGFPQVRELGRTGVFLGITKD